MFNENLCLLAFDHRSYFEKHPSEKIFQFKSLVYQAVNKADSKKARIGIIVDDEEILKDAAKKNLFTARCIEAVDVNPLSFLEDKEASAILRSWPTEHVIKVLCRVPGQPVKKLCDLYEATKQTGHKLLIELRKC